MAVSKRIFQINNKIQEKEYKKMLFFAFMKRKYMLLFFIISSLVSSLLISYVLDKFTFSYILFIFLVFFSLSMLMQLVKLNTEYKTLKREIGDDYFDKVQTYDFYDDSFTHFVPTLKIFIRYYYKDLIDLKETPDYIFIYTNAKQIVFIKKEGLETDTIEQIKSLINS